MSNVIKGGRGITAPYQSTHCRVPLPLKATIDKLVNEYRLQVGDGADTANLIEKVEEVIDNPNKPVNELINTLSIEQRLEAAKSEIECLTGFLKEETDRADQSEQWSNMQYADYLEQQQRISKAESLLNEALSLKANAGGAIKAQIRAALLLLHTD